MRHPLVVAVCVVAGVLACPSRSQAQDRPFVFSLSTASPVGRPQLRVDYEVGVGDQVFHQQTANGPEQRVGVQATSGRFTFIGHVGLAKSGGSFDSTQQGEVLFAVFQNASKIAVSAGGGVLHEAGGANVLLARLTAGHEGARMRVHGNLMLQKPLATGRDAIDLITSAGWAARVSSAVSIGVEAVGEDLEGFWDSAEAEGGSRLLIGPSIHVAPPSQKWQLSIAGGPTFHPSDTNRSSTAVRTLPASTATRDYAARMTFAVRF